MALRYTVAQSAVKAIEALATLIFPSECLCCGQEGAWLCKMCHTSCHNAPLTCPICSSVSNSGQTCQTCQSQTHLNGAGSLWQLTGPARAVVYGLKYHGYLAAAGWCGAMLSELIDQLPINPSTPLLITSIPTPRQRLIERGYNQSETLARAVARARYVPYRTLLRRQTARAPSQTTLDREARWKNMANQFSLGAPKNSLTGSVIIIVDDVLTTGATLSSAAAVLHDAGATAIWGLTLTRD